MVVGYAAGGGADGIIRAIAPELSEALGQQIIVDNRPGGGTVIGTQIVAAAKPDGYTMYVMDNAFIVNPVLVGKLPYDSLRDFTPVAGISSSSTTLAVVHPSLPVKSVKELVALARAQPGQAQLRLGRQRHRAARDGRTVQRGGEDQAHAHPLQEHRARDLRGDQRRNHGRLRRHLRGQGPGRHQQAARAGDRRQRAQRRHAGGADLRRVAAGRRSTPPATAASSRRRARRATSSCA